MIYSQLPEHRKIAIRESAAKHVNRQREKGNYRPIQFSTLDPEYAEKFEYIYIKCREKNNKITKLDIFKEMIDKFVI